MAISNKLAEFIKSLTTPEREEAINYVLSKLVGERLERGESVAVTSPEGTILGHIHPPAPPTAVELIEMQDRARRIIPGTGHSTSELLQRLKEGDEVGVKKFTNRRSTSPQR